MDFYERIKLLVKQSNTTIEDMLSHAFEDNDPEKLNLQSYNTLRRRNNLPRAYEACKIAQALGVTVEYLVSEKINSHSEKTDPKTLALAQKLAKLTESQQKKIEGIIEEFENISKPESFYVSEPTPAYNTDITDIVALPYYGRVAAGDPLDVSVAPGEFIHFPRQGLRGNAKDHFALTVTGYSMTEAGIVDGATIVIKKAEEPAYGEIMLVRYENSITLKRVIKQEGKVYLAWENGTGKKIEVNSSEYHAEGILVWAMKQFTGTEH